MTNRTKFIIAALLIIVAVLGYQNFQNGGFDNVQGVNVPTEKSVESH